MKTINKQFADRLLIGKVLLLLATLSVLSCSKEETDQNQPIDTDVLLPPIADAGPDQEIVYPSHKVILNGSNSKSQGGSISTWFWEKIEGPYSYSMYTDAGNEKIATVEGLQKGTYLFELTVTNTAGLTAKDTVQVKVRVPDFCGDDTNRIPVSANMVPVSTLPKTNVIAMTSARNKIFFAGDSQVNIYDITSQSWTVVELSVERYNIAAVANDSKVFFAGGIVTYGGWGEYSQSFDDVDIYDMETDIWTHTHLSIAGGLIAATAIGDKVLFAGGYNENTTARQSRVDIYNQTSGEWTTASLSDNKPTGNVAVSVGDRAFFAGSGTSKVDVYDAVTNTWSVETMYEGKSDLAGIASNGKIYWAGGSTPDLSNTHSYGNYYSSLVVEVWDTSTSDSTLACLNQAGHPKAVQQGGKIVFLSLTPWITPITHLDIYDPDTNSWYYGSLPYHITSAISVNDTIYVTVPENGNTIVSVLELF